MASDGAPARVQRTPTPSPPRRRLLRWAVRGAAAVAVLAVLLGLAGLAWERTASGRFADRFPPPGRLVTLEDGRDLHVVVKGEGEPTLVLESGAGGPHTDWAGVFDELAETTRVIAYDRAGYGWSDPSSSADATSIVADLHEALDLLGISGPIVLAGHSIGGVYVRHYASLHPERVAGLVFIDSSHEDQEARLPEPVADMMASMQLAMTAVAFGSRFGLVRAASRAGVLPEGALPIPSGTAPPEVLEMRVRSSVLRSMAREYGAIPESVEQSLESGSDFGDTAILVLSASRLPPMPPAMAPYADEMQATWAELQAEFATYSSDTRHLVVEGAGHYIHWDRPDIVIEEVTAMFEAIRADRSLASIDAVTARGAPPPP